MTNMGNTNTCGICKLFLCNSFRNSCPVPMPSWRRIGIWQKTLIPLSAMCHISETPAICWILLVNGIKSNIYQLTTWQSRYYNVTVIIVYKGQPFPGILLWFYALPLSDYLKRRFLYGTEKRTDSCGTGRKRL